jgi:hypothetical protein
MEQHIHNSSTNCHTGVTLRLIHPDDIIDVFQEDINLNSNSDSHLVDDHSPTNDDDEPLPPQIKNKNMDQILKDWQLKNPPKLRRQTNNTYLQEFYAWVDKKLDWLSMTVEEEDNEDKNHETFGTH